MARKVVLFCALSFTAMIGGCNTAQDGVPALGSRELAPEEKKIIADAVGRVIKDPRAAKFRWAKFPSTTANGDVNYCASVQAKSTLPGNSGDQLYIAVVGTENNRVKNAVVGAIHGGADAHVVRNLCKRYGLNPDEAV